ncbi:polysaccharide deacetylase family protein [Actinomadura hibisca]|uniref:polysaccharide deacetylase family protein n=1 Tax=Actinomadura hibisca TaxID=68565 RepID=UPI000A7C3ADE|nr:polysaccharide deacetylase family protein [Actinomadura hibisca]
MSDTGDERGRRDEVDREAEQGAEQRVQQQDGQQDEARGRAGEGARRGRRRFLKGAGIAAGGAAAGAVGGALLADGGQQSILASVGSDLTPDSAMAVPVAGPWRPRHNGHVDIVYSVDTAQKLVALTFDDGPMPNWTPMVHDVLDAEQVKATFFLVGERLVRNGGLIKDRMARHEAANHTWAHQNLSRMTHPEALAAIGRAHRAIGSVLGREARLLRPPFGHFGGTAVSAAGQLGYDMTLWSIKMLEKTYEAHPPKLVDYIVGNTQQGGIVLAHDTGNPDRLVALRNLVPMIRGLRAKGFEFVTVSELREAGARSPAPAPAEKP